MQRTEEIKDIIGTLRDLKDDAQTHRNQIAYLLYTNVEKQRAESATKILVKNFWKYPETSDILMQQQHREAIIQRFAKEAGVTEDQINKFTFDHKKGRQISPFTMIDTKDSTHRLAILEWQRKEIKEKNLHTEERPTSDAVKASGKHPWIERMPETSARHQWIWQAPVRATQGLHDCNFHLTQKQSSCRHSWKHLTIQLAEKDEYVLWIAMDYSHLRRCKVRSGFQGSLPKHTLQEKCRQERERQGQCRQQTHASRPLEKRWPERWWEGFLPEGWIPLTQGRIAWSPFLFTVRPIEAEQFYAKC